MTPTPTVSAESIAVALHARRSGARWMARCPAHDDKGPSLSIVERDGVVLVHCFSGCPQTDVLRALRAQGLWPEHPPLSETERRAWGRARAAATAAAVKLDHWRQGQGMRLQDIRLEAAARGNIEDGARELYLLMSAGPAELARMYAAAEPRLRARDEAAGRRWRTLCEKLCAWVVTRTGETLPDARSTP